MRKLAITFVLLVAALVYINVAAKIMCAAVPQAYPEGTCK